MNLINYLKGDVTVPQSVGTKIIAHICNDIGGWGKGFVVAISNKWKEPEASFREWYRSREENDFSLGATKLVQVETDLYVANMIGQKGVKRQDKRAPIRYEAVVECLKTTVRHAEELNASIHMPRIGCGLAGGRWEEIEPLILEALDDTKVQVFVYDFE